MRRPKTAVALVVLSAITALAGRTWAGAWVQPRNGYYIKVAGSYLSTREEFNFRGDRQSIFADDPSKSNTSFRDVSISAYVEYGLTRDITLVAALPFKIVTTKETQEVITGVGVRRELTNGGLGDLTVSLRTPLLRDPLALALEGGVKLPLGYEKAPDNEGPPLGTGEVDGEIYFLIGRSLYPLSAYIGAGIGYRFRGGPLHDEVRFTAEGGYTFGPLFVKLSLDGVKNTTDPPDLGGGTVMTPGPGGGGVIQDVVAGDQDVLKLTPGVTYAVAERIAVSAEAFHILAGKDTVTGTTYSIGVVFTR